MTITVSYLCPTPSNKYYGRLAFKESLDKQPRMYRIFLFPFYLASEPKPAKSPIVETKYGLVEGFVHEIGSDGGHRLTADIFLGIPYAKPPVGELRFEKPESPEQFPNGTLKADKFGPGCASFAPLIGEPHFSEDCLQLNVFSPSEKSLRDANGFPVLVFIHGGGFTSGSAKMYGYVPFAANFVSRGIVVVTVQYRLGMFGLFSTGDKTMSGNLALWDQRAALLWIQDNIQQFGGDPKRVTLWGQNSGSANVGALSLSKWTRDLFSQAIEMSGSVYAGWATSNSTVMASKKIAKLLNCPTKESKKLKTCLKDVSTEQLSAAGSKLGWRRDDVNFVRLGMRLDGDFFDKDLDSLLRDSPRKPTIQGITSQESMIMTLPFNGAPKDSTLIIPQDKWQTFDRERLVKFINATVVPEGLFGDKTDEVRKAVIWFYADRNVSADPKFYLTRYTQVLSDMQFAIPALMEVSKKSRENWPVFLYLINYMSPIFQFPILGTFQTYEFPYLFGFSLVGDFKFDENDRKLQRVMINALANFVISGNPSSEFGIWPAVTQEHPFGFFDMRPDPVLRDNLMLDRQLFWANLTSTYDEFNLVRDFHKDTFKPKNDF
ncbi:carboxylesterase family domain-containing protein [Ditylenchus destructor]|nr:carboxylesterase family domain-containing protein [Ditylenchus destructor]